MRRTQRKTAALCLLSIFELRMLLSLASSLLNLGCQFLRRDQFSTADLVQWHNFCLAARYSFHFIVKLFQIHFWNDNCFGCLSHLSDYFLWEWPQCSQPNVTRSYSFPFRILNGFVG